MLSDIAQKIRVIDTDAHTLEPYDCFTSRVSRKWGDRVPHVRTDPSSGLPMWFLNGAPAMPAASAAMAGWKDWPPSFPPGIEDADPAAHDPIERLKRMDEYGLYAQILYPNANGYVGEWQDVDRNMLLECYRAYNDFLVDWCKAAPERLIAVAALPFWNVGACVEEIARCQVLGHHGLQLTAQPETFGLNHLGHPEWEPVWCAAEEAGLPIGFHVASGNVSEAEAFDGYKGNGKQTNFAKGSVNQFLSVGKTLMELIASGVCHRHPMLDFVSTEHGIGWIPFMLEAFDWQWLNTGARQEHPELNLLPSEYFKRQMYACFWFEQGAARAAIDLLGPDNFFYETDFPHLTSMAPGPASAAELPSRFIDRVFAGLPEVTARKVLHDNAARVFGLSS